MHELQLNHNFEPIEAYDDLEAEYNDGTIRVQETEYGKGVFADRIIAKQEPILEIPFIPEDTMDFHKAAELEAQGGHVYVIQIDTDRYLDPRPPARYLNHSCNPNAGLMEQAGKFIVVALREIQPEEQITFDYSTDCDENYFTMECKCGNPLCREVVGDFKNLPSDLQQKYLDLGVVPKFIAEQYTPETLN